MSVNGEDLVARLAAGDSVRTQVLARAALSKSDLDDVLDALAVMHRQAPANDAVIDAFVSILQSQRFLHAEVSRLIFDPNTAEDVIQEVLLKATRGLFEFRGESKVRTWVRRIAHNEAVGVLRRRQESVGREADLAGQVEEVMRFSSILASRHDLHVALDRLSPDFAEVVRLRDIEQLTYDQIAERTGLKLNTVRSRLARGRAKLAVELGL